MRPFARLVELPLPAWIFKKRFIKFRSVGVSGMLVDMGMPYLGQEFLFTSSRSADMPLNVSSGLAISCACVGE